MSEYSRINGVAKLEAASSLSTEVRPADRGTTTEYKGMNVLELETFDKKHCFQRICKLTSSLFTDSGYLAD